MGLLSFRRTRRAPDHLADSRIDWNYLGTSADPPSALRLVSAAAREGLGACDQRRALPSHDPDEIFSVNPFDSSRRGISALSPAGRARRRPARRAGSGA